MTRNSHLTTIAFGAMAVLLGGFYVLGGAGLFPLKGHADGVAICTGAVLAGGGLAAMLATLPGAVSRRAISVLALAAVLGFALVAGWIALGRGHSELAGQLAPLRDLSGRAAFGVGGVISALMAALIVHRALQAPSSPS